MAIGSGRTATDGARGPMRQFIEFVRVLINRRRLVELLEMNDHELRDIGLTRQDVKQVLRLPLSTDPSGALNEIAQRRIAGPDMERSRDHP